MQNNREHQEQVALINWTQCIKAKYPVLDMIFAIRNGGSRHITVARKLKAEGVKSGLPDLCLPVARNGCHALYIEMKISPNKVSPVQEQKIVELRVEGNRAVVCWSWIEAAREICRYLNIDYKNAGVGK